MQGHVRTAAFREEKIRVRNEIGYMEDRIEEIVGQQLHLEVENVGVYDFEAVKVFQVGGASYILNLCVSREHTGEGYLLRADDLGDGWWNVVEITDDTEWERAKAASGWQEKTTVVHR